MEHTWGEIVDSLGPPFDVIACCDVMYIEEAVPALVASLAALAAVATRVFVAHGRNRGAETAFRKAARAAGFSIREVSGEELDEVYQSADVSVLELQQQEPSAAQPPPGGQRVRTEIARPCPTLALPCMQYMSYLYT